MGKLYAIIGPSGSGKSTIGQYVFGKENELVSTTTRPMRRNELNGKHYHFIDKDKFLFKMSLDKFAEMDFYDGNYYGLTHDEIYDKTNDGDAYVVITRHGYQQLKSLYPDIVSVFIDASKEHVEAMLRGRNDSNIEKRLELYESETQQKQFCDYVIHNEFGNMEKAVFQLLCLKNGEMDKFEELQRGNSKQSSEEVEIDG